MDISGLTSTTSGAFTGYGGTSALPSQVQAKLMTQSQSLSLLPPVSSLGSISVPDIYQAVNMQAMGALSGLSSVELAQAQIAGRGGSPPASAADPAASPPASAGGSTAAGDAPAAAPAKDPPVGAALDELLKEDGYQPQDNPYEYRKDFFSDRGSLGGLLDSVG